MKTKFFVRVVGSVAAALAAAQAAAAGPDMAGLVGAVDESTVVQGVLGIAAGLAVVYVARQAWWQVEYMLIERHAFDEAEERDRERWG